MSVNRVKKFVLAHQNNPPETFNIGGKQFTWERALRYCGISQKDIKVDQDEAKSTVVDVEPGPEDQGSGAGDSESQE